MQCATTPFSVIRPKGSAMAMQTKAVRFEPDEIEWIQAYADFTGRSFSETVRQAVLEEVEEAADMRAYEEALAADGGERYSMEQVMAMALVAE